MAHPAGARGRERHASQTEVWLDGTPVAALTASNVAFGVYTAIGQLELGAKATSSSTYDVALDEVAYDREPIGDATPPDAPGSFAATAHSGLRVDLAWTPSRDDIGTVAYDIYRDGLPIASVGPVTGFADPTVAAAHLLHLRGGRARRGGQRQRAQPDAVGDDAGRVHGRLRVGRPVAVDELEWRRRAVGRGRHRHRRRRGDQRRHGGRIRRRHARRGAPELYYRARFDVLGRGANSVSLLRLRDTANGAIASAFISSTGKLGLRNDVTALTTTSTAAVTAGWHELQLHVNTDPPRRSPSSTSTASWCEPQRQPRHQPAGQLELGDPSVGRVFDVAFDGVVVDPGFIADLAPPSAPGSLRATAASGNEVDLAWTPPPTTSA